MNCTYKLILYSFFLIIISSKSYAQKETWNWYFNQNCGITFLPSGDSAIILYDGQWLGGGSSAISDKNGNLLFYSDGKKIWSKNHRIMENGDDLLGGIPESKYLSVLIVQKPRSVNLYYVFYIRYISTSENSKEFGNMYNFYYSLVDINQNNGLGKVIEKNKKIQKGLFSNPISGIRHRNGEDIWIVIRSLWGNSYFSYLLTKDSLIAEPVISSIGYYTPELPDEWDIFYLSCMKIDPTGRKLAFTPKTSSPIIFELFKFNDSSGTISDPILVNNGVHAWDLEFSPDGNKLYTRDYQFDVTYHHPDSILASEYYFGDSSGAYQKILQLGPDGKIYFTGPKTPNSPWDQRYLGVIGNPNENGLKCNYNYKQIYFSGRIAFCLPNMLASYFRERIGIELEDSIVICETETLSIIPQLNDTAKNIKYEWTTPDNKKYFTKDIIIPNAKTGHSGKYKLRAEDDRYRLTFLEVYVTVKPKPDAKINTLGSTAICPGEQKQLQALPFGEEYIYLWSTGENKPIITLNTPGIYSLIVTNKEGCSDTAEVEITQKKQIEAKIIGDSVFCEGESIILKVEPVGSEYQYLWSNGQRTNQINVTKEGMYWVIVSAKDSCSGSDTLEVIVADKPDIEIISDGKPILCKGGILKLKIKTENQNLKYHWSTDETTDEIIINSAGNYSVIAESEFGCRDTAYITIEQGPQIDVNIIGDTILCVGASSKLTLNNEFSTYLWSTGETTNEIIVNTPGFYSVTVTDVNGCTGADTIEVELIDIQLDRSNFKNIDFGNVCVGDIPFAYPKLQNISNWVVSIKNIYLKSGLDTFKLLNRISLPLRLNKNEEIKLTLTYKPRKTGINRDSLIVEINEPCPMRFGISIYGVAKERSYIDIPELKAKGGENICIPVFARLAGDDKLILSFNTIININSDAFFPDEGFNSWIDSEKRKIELTGNNIEISNEYSEIGRICGKVLLPVNDLNPITIEKFEWNDKDICNEMIDGSLELIDVCIQDQRKIQLFTSLSLNIIPNPSDDKIKLEIKMQPDNFVVIKIYNSTGFEVYSQGLIGKSSDQKIEINTMDFAPGFYIIKAHTQTESVSQRLMLIK